MTVAGWFRCRFTWPHPSLGGFLAAARRSVGDFTRSGASLRFAIAAAAAWVALESVRGLGALSFGWNGLGIALHGNLALVQVVEYTGVGGLSLLVALTNLIAVLTIRRF